MGLFKSLFGSGVPFSEKNELEELINETLLATYKWSSIGEPSGGNEIVEAANSIRNNFERILHLYKKVKSKSQSNNITIKNNVIPPPFPSELNAHMMILGIIDHAEAIANKNPSFKRQLINQSLLNQVML